MSQNIEDHSDKSIIFFDGVCNICNFEIDYIIRQDSHQKFYFSSLQSPFAKSFLASKNLDVADMSTLILFDQNKIYKRSEAVFRIFRNLNGIVPLFSRLFSILPSFITDKIYNLIANNRYRIAGKRSSCRLPSEKEASRFLK